MDLGERGDLSLVALRCYCNCAFSKFHYNNKCVVQWSLKRQLFSYAVEQVHTLLPGTEQMELCSLQPLLFPLYSIHPSSLPPPGRGERACVGECSTD